MSDQTPWDDEQDATQRLPRQSPHRDGQYDTGHTYDTDSEYGNGNGANSGPYRYTEPPVEPQTRREARDARKSSAWTVWGPICAVLAAIGVIAAVFFALRHDPNPATPSPDQPGISNPASPQSSQAPSTTTVTKTTSSDPSTTTVTSTSTTTAPPSTVTTTETETTTETAPAATDGQESPTDTGN